MSMQWAHPLIWDARSFTSSKSERSRPQLRTNVCRARKAFSPCGEDLRKSNRAFIANLRSREINLSVPTNLQSILRSGDKSLGHGLAGLDQGEDAAVLRRQLGRTGAASARK